MKLTITIFILFLTSIFGNSNSDIKIFTDKHFPPFNMEIDGKLTGLSVDILDAMLKKMNSNQSIKDVLISTWSRAYALTQLKKNSVLLSTSKSSSREGLFKWVGPMFSSSIGLIALKKNNIKIKKISDINKYKIGVVLKDIGATKLYENNVSRKNMNYSKGAKAPIFSFKKLELGKIDLFSYSILPAFYEAKNNGFDINKYEVVYTFKKEKVYFAFNKQTDDKIINQWQKALDDIKKDGSFDKILKKYNV